MASPHPSQEMDARPMVHLRYNGVRHTASTHWLCESQPPAVKAGGSDLCPGCDVTGLADRQVYYIPQVATLALKM